MLDIGRIARGGSLDDLSRKHGRRPATRILRPRSVQNPLGTRERLRGTASRRDARHLNEFRVRRRRRDDDATKRA
jgi:hypothetical protein